MGELTQEVPLSTENKLEPGSVATELIDDLVAKLAAAQHEIVRLQEEVRRVRAKMCAAIKKERESGYAAVERTRRDGQVEMRVRLEIEREKAYETQRGLRCQLLDEKRARVGYLI